MEILKFKDCGIIKYSEIYWKADERKKLRVVEIYFYSWKIGRIEQLYIDDLPRMTFTLISEDLGVIDPKIAYHNHHYTEGSEFYIKKFSSMDEAIIFVKEKFSSIDNMRKFYVDHTVENLYEFEQITDERLMDLTIEKRERTNDWEIYLPRKYYNGELKKYTVLGTIKRNSKPTGAKKVYDVFSELLYIDVKGQWQKRCRLSKDTTLSEAKKYIKKYFSSKELIEVAHINNVLNLFDSVSSKINHI